MDPGTTNDGNDRRRWQVFAEGTSVRGEHPDLTTIAAFIDRRLSDPERRALESHLADCGRCSELVHEAHLLLESRETPVLVPKQVVERARSLVAGTSGATGATGPAWRLVGWWAAAAVVAIGVGVGGYEAGRLALPADDVQARLADAVSFSLDRTDTIDLAELLGDEVTR